MAATVTDLKFGVQGDRRVNVGTVTGDTSYTTGGYALAPGAVGLGSVDRLSIDLPVNSTPAIRGAVYNRSTSKLAFFDQAFAEIAAGVDLSAFAARFEVTGL